MPAFNFAYNIVALLYIGALRNEHVFPPTPGESIAILPFLKGVLLSYGQIYACPSLPSSVVLHLAMAVGSPLLLLHSVCGALVGSGTGALLVCFYNTAMIGSASVYAGELGLNSFLTSGAVASCFVLTWRAHLLSPLAGILAAFVNIAIGRLLQPSGLQPLALAFVVTASVMLLVDGGGLRRIRVDALSTAEKHLLGADDDEGEASAALIEESAGSQQYNTFSS